MDKIFFVDIKKPLCGYFFCKIFGISKIIRIFAAQYGAIS
jgi:hypothetical protein